MVQGTERGPRYGVHFLCHFDWASRGFSAVGPIERRVRSVWGGRRSEAPLLPSPKHQRTLRVRMLKSSDLDLLPTVDLGAVIKFHMTAPSIRKV